MIVHVLCVPGGHSVQTVTDDPMRVPEGWTLVEADCVPVPRGPNEPWAPAIWYLKAGGTKVLCCPQHPLQYDPSN